MFTRYKFLSGIFSKIGGFFGWILADKFRVLFALFLLLFINYLHVRGTKNRIKEELEQRESEIKIYQEQIPELQKILKIQRDSLGIQKKELNKRQIQILEDERLLAQKDSTIDMKDGQILSIQVTLRKVLEREKSKDRQLSNAKAALSKCVNYNQNHDAGQS